MNVIDKGDQFERKNKRALIYVNAEIIMNPLREEFLEKILLELLIGIEK